MSTQSWQSRGLLLCQFHNQNPLVNLMQSEENSFISFSVFHSQCDTESGIIWWRGTVKLKSLGTSRSAVEWMIIRLDIIIEPQPSPQHTGYLPSTKVQILNLLQARISRTQSCIFVYYQSQRRQATAAVCILEAWQLLSFCLVFREEDRMQVFGKAFSGRMMTPLAGSYRRLIS